MTQTNILFASLIFLCSCTLSSNQENSLNKQLSSYVQAYNESNTLVYAGLTHPVVVRYYQSISDSTFILHFKTRTDTCISYLSNPVYNATKNRGDWIERKYTLTKSNSLNETTFYQVFAVSEDAGENWFFINQEDYFDSNIPLQNHLFIN